MSQEKKIEFEIMRDGYRVLPAEQGGYIVQAEQPHAGFQPIIVRALSNGEDLLAFLMQAHGVVIGMDLASADDKDKDKDEAATDDYSAELPQPPSAEAYCHAFSMGMDGRTVTVKGSFIRDGLDVVTAQQEHPVPEPFDGYGEVRVGVDYADRFAELARWRMSPRPVARAGALALRLSSWIGKARRP